MTYIVGPETGPALSAGSAMIATGVPKAILVMVLAPLPAPLISLDRPHSRMVSNGMAGTVSSVLPGPAIIELPSGSLRRADGDVYTGLGCLLAPSSLFFALRGPVGG